MSTRAELKGDRYVLNGTKAWCTNGPRVGGKGGQGRGLPAAFAGSKPRRLGPGGSQQLHCAESHPPRTPEHPLPPATPPPPQASTIIVYAKTAPDKGAHGITAFIVEKGMKVERGVWRGC
jgi:hypothetical protein